MPFGAGVRIGLGIHHQGVGVAAVGDPHLGAVEHVAVALLSARSFMLTTSELALLAYRQRADVVAGDQLGQVFLLLGPAAALRRIWLTHRLSGRRRQAHRCGGAGDFLEGDDVGQVAHVGAASTVIGTVMPCRPKVWSPLLPEVGGANRLSRSTSAARGRSVRSYHLAKAHGTVSRSGLDGFAEMEVQAGMVHGWVLAGIVLGAPPATLTRRKNSCRAGQPPGIRSGDQDGPRR